MEHNHEHDHEHAHSTNPLIEWFQHTFTPHDHGYQVAALDPALATDRGIHAVKVSLAALLLTAAFQVIIVAISGSVALLADTIHNFSDALTAIPLGLAFTLSRRARNSRYTYGYGRAEDIAGVIIVVMILFTALEAIRQSVLKIMHPQPITNIGWVAAAGVIGFLGNELVALFRIRIGKQIGSAALIADGNHARADGFTSLAVVAGAIGVWLGYPSLDPIVGLGIGAAILVIVWNSARDMYYRVMDAVEPKVTETITKIASQTINVMDVHDVAVRWVGHRQRAELHIIVDCQMPTCDSHRIAETVRHDLFHAMPALADVTIHVDPCECERCGNVHESAHHLSPAAG
ncbi:MAG: cation diffusion facilitator family transporter [Anaerolineales bacterium]|nr:cation diffusion facilitator family transporter [Anaerolineales bacterium]